MTVKTDLTLTVKVKEEASNDLGDSQMVHLLSISKFFGSGTGANQADVVYSDSFSAAASPVTYDLLGSLSSVLTGSAINFVEVVGVFVVNDSTTSTENLTIGAGSNPVTGLWAASGDAAVIGPGGLFAWTSPVDGVAPVAGTGDILTIDPGSDTIAGRIVVLGRSAA